MRKALFVTLILLLAGGLAHAKQKITDPSELRKAGYLVEAGGYECSDPEWMTRKARPGRNANHKLFRVSCSGTTYSVEWHNGAGARVEPEGWF
jgi:hypothetical protein